MNSDHIVIIPVFLLAARYTMSQFERPYHLYVSHDTFPNLDWINGLMVCAHNDDVVGPQREKLQDAVPVSVAHRPHHEHENCAKEKGSSPLIK